MSGSTVTYTYNALNLKSQLTNARGQTRNFTYDILGRITGCTDPDDSTAFTYDANGNVLTATDENGTITRTFDALNRVTSCTDTLGKTITYAYDAVGNLSRLTYPDNTSVTYEYDENNNLVKVTDWANRVTTYTYDVNNRVIGVIKPDGSITTTVYDNMQRVTSTVEKTSSGAVITGFEYTYDDLSRIVDEKALANSTKMCYTYDELSRVLSRTVKNLGDDSVISTETFTYDAAGNITGGSADTTFVYDTNNRLTSYNGNAVTYDLDGNMLDNGTLTCTYDSSNKLVTANGHTYTYNAEDVRIRNLTEEEDTTYTYDTNCRLSKLLTKTTNGVTTKYVYGRGLIGEEVNNTFKTYHFDFRGSTIAITDISGTITDTFAYDTYGNQIARTGTSDVIFCYNGRDGVITESNGLIYMRARYYSPDMRRFVNADIVAGNISNAVTLNRFAYANGNPISYVDPFGLSVLVMLGLMAIGGLISATVNAVASVAEQQKNHGEVNLAEVAVDAAWGFVEGAVSSSPLCVVGKVAADAVVSFGNQMTDAYFDSDNKENGEWLKEVDPWQVGINVTIDTIFSVADNIKEAGKVADTIDEMDDLLRKKKREKRRKEQRRGNSKVADKRISNINNQLFDKFIIDPIAEVVPTPMDISKYGTKKTVNAIYDETKEYLKNQRK